MRCGRGDRIEALAGRGMAADEVIPRRFAELSAALSLRGRQIGIGRLTPGIGDRVRDRVPILGRNRVTGRISRRCSGVPAPVQSHLPMDSPLLRLVLFGALRLAGMVG